MPVPDFRSLLRSDWTDMNDTGADMNAMQTLDSKTARAPYQAPRLVHYGHVAELTCGAAGSGNDGGPAYMNRRPQGFLCDLIPILPWCN